MKRKKRPKLLKAPASEIPKTRKDTTALLREVVAGYLFALRYAVYLEIELGPRKSGLRLPGGRCDVLGVNYSGDIVIVEIKSGLADYRADKKWRNYKPYANRLYVAFPPGVNVPQDLKDDPDTGILMPGSSGRLRVVKRSKWHPVNGKLKKVTVLGLVYRAADRTRLTHRQVLWPIGPQTP